jgi:chromosome segregation ATPase
MADQPSDPRGLRRLQALEANLDALRASSERLAAERAELQQRLEEAEGAAGKAQSDESKLQGQIDEAMAVFEQLIEQGALPARERRRTLPAFSQAVARQLSGVSEKVATAEERLAQLGRERKELENQLAAAEKALREALSKIEDLQNQINTRVATSEGRVQELEAALAEARATIQMLEDDNQTVSRLIEENRRLASQTDELSRDITVVRGAAEEAKAGLEQAQSETEARVRAELAGEIQAIQKKHDNLQQQLNTALQQLQTEGKTPYIPPAKVAEMINDLVKEMQGSLGGLDIRDGEVKLKVGFGVVGETGGFLVPTPESTPEVKESLQEITFHFDRSALAPGGFQTLSQDVPK